MSIPQGTERRKYFQANKKAASRAVGKEAMEEVLRSDGRYARMLAAAERVRQDNLALAASGDMSVGGEVVIPASAHQAIVGQLDQIASRLRELASPA